MTPRIPPPRLSLAYFAWAVYALYLPIAWAFISVPYSTRLVTSAGSMVRRPPHAEPQEQVPGVGASGGGGRSELELWRDLRCDLTPQERTQWLLSEAKAGDTVLLPLVAERAADEAQAVAAAHSRGVVVLVVDEGGGLLLQASKAGGAKDDAIVGAYRRVDTSSSSLGSVMSLVGCVEWVLMDCINDWTMIPLENVVAAAHNSGTKIAVLIKDAAQVSGAAFALDLGVNALALPHHDSEAWAQALVAQAHRRDLAATHNTNTTTTTQPHTAGASSNSEGVRVVEGVVTGVGSGGVGHRVCLDLIQTLQAGEGALVGSSAKALCLVQAEVMPSPFVPPRPFRVNAGPVHSYVLMADGSTKYLSEVVAGDQVLIVDTRSVLPSGGYGCRGVGVGRCKVESRPTLLLSYSYSYPTTAAQQTEEASAQVFLQQAETVRVLSKAGTQGSVPVTEIKPGDTVLLRLQAQGTHLGKAIAAQVTEK